MGNSLRFCWSSCVAHPGRRRSNWTFCVGSHMADETFDEVDARLLLLLTASPRLGVLECARRLGVARGTVQARLDKLTARGVLGGFPPALDLGAMGYGLTAFAVVEIAQG